MRKKINNKQAARFFPLALSLILAGGCSLTGPLLTAGAPRQPAVPGDADHPAVLWPAAAAGPAPAVTTAEAAETETAPGPEQDAGSVLGPPDLWDRVRAGFALPRRSHPRIERELAWLRRHPDYLDRVADRARPYLHFIVEEVERRGMPLEIALLPVVESAFQPFAYSHGRAAGIWQFIPSTGRRFGLRQTWWYDGRRDVYASTHAALDLLQRLHREFDGDWLLALAAYNSGSGTVHKAVRRNRRRGKPADFFSLRLPRETRGYVPKLLALKQLVEDPAAHGITLKSIPDEPYFARVELDSQIDLALAAELAGIDLEELYRLNPGFNRWATDPDGPHHLLLPLERVEPFRRALAQLPPERRLRWVRHRVRPGETLITIARRYRTTVATIKRVNRLRGNLIRAGRGLTIPVASRSRKAYTLSADQRRARTQNRPRGGQRVVHRVQPGDTLWDLARRYGVGVRQLARWNAMSPRDPLRPGQRLVIWTRGRAALPARIDAPPPRRRITRRIGYRVRPGDSLARISRKFKVTVEQLRRWNRLRKGAYLQPGQRLTLYIDVTRQSS